MSTPPSAVTSQPGTGSTRGSTPSGSSTRTRVVAAASDSLGTRTVYSANAPGEGSSTRTVTCADAAAAGTSSTAATAPVTPTLRSHRIRTPPSSRRGRAVPGSAGEVRAEGPGVPARGGIPCATGPFYRGPPMPPPDPGLRRDLADRLPGLLLHDQHRLARRLAQARADDAALAKVAAQITAAERRAARRRAAVPAVAYPASLPISARVDDIRAAIRDHQVVVVAGETGSGKTTQLPKVCLELGRGVNGMIGHTQPRRIAARTVAERIAAELDVGVGQTVGYTYRFTDRTSDQTLVKVMTDGTLLAEIDRDRMLRRYDTIIIDEAHERSLTIDFLLGYLAQLLPRRPDLKVVVTSATIDPDRFAQHFGGAPVIEVSGRTYPVEVRYRPFEEDDDRDQVQAICDAVDELAAEAPGDVLVFLSGEREIRDTADALRASSPGTEVLPLYGRLSTAEQRRVFAPHRGRRVVLATNVAETSLTVPGIRYVVDPGTARISRYSARTKVQRLPIEAVSQASADQRKGRCGRTADGICIRLYSEEDFLARPAFTEPEILRTNLASVILQMTALGLGDVEGFPFLDPPDRRSVRDGVALLQELGALEERRLTPTGRSLSRLPIDPRFARMVVEADRNGCVAEVLVIAAALSIQDPRERPADQQGAADEAHARFADDTSDFLSWLHLWRYLQEQQDALSSGQFRRRCRAEFLNFLRVREWQDLHAQLRATAADLGLGVDGDPAAPADVHRSVLAGLLSQIGLRDGDAREYQGARGVRFAVFPGSGLARKPPRWVMAAELVETSRLWARVAARIEPEWAEALAPHLVTRTHSEPRWDRERGAVVATERVTLYGLPLVVGRRVDYARIDPLLSRELFLRRALVEGDWDTRHAFAGANRALVDDVRDLEDRARRRDLLVDDEALLAFYDARVPAQVTSARAFDRWYRDAVREQPDLLRFDRGMLVRPGAAAVTDADFPRTLQAGAVAVPLRYRFAPGAPDDGVTAEVPLAVLNRVDPVALTWHVPGHREELVTELIRTLPKPVRRTLVPAPDRARAVLAAVRPDEGPLLAALERELRRQTGVAVPRDAWRPDLLPPHLRVHVRVVDDAGRPVEDGDDLALLQLRLRDRTRASVAAAAEDVERRGLRAWDLGDLPRTVDREIGGQVVRAYPALVDEGETVGVRVLTSPTEQQRAMWRGTRRLLLLTVPSPIPLLRGRLTNAMKLALTRSPYPNVGAMLEDAVATAVDDLVAEHGGPAWDAAGFARLRDAVRADLPDAVVDVLGVTEKILTAARRVEERIGSLTNPALAPAVADLRGQLAGLVHRGFLSATGRRRLPDLLRYLRAMDQRLDKLAAAPGRDAERMAAVLEVQSAFLAALRAQGPGRPNAGALRGVRWLLEELRVNTFAQSVGTPSPISAKRVYRALEEAAGRPAGVA